MRRGGMRCWLGGEPRVDSLACLVVMRGMPCDVKTTGEADVPGSNTEETQMTKRGWSDESFASPRSPAHVAMFFTGLNLR